MTPIESLAAFSVAAAIITVTPGVDTALVLRTAAVESRQRAVAAGMGICTGVMLWGVTAAVGLGALLTASEVGYTLLRWIGGGYLLYLGARMLLSPRAGWAEEPAGQPGSGRGWYGRGLLTNLLNPKVGAFYVTFLPPFIPDDVAVAPFTLLLAAIHVAETLLWFAALILATRPLGRVLHRPAVTRALDRLTGGVLIAFGVKLVTDSRP